MEKMMRLPEVKQTVGLGRSAIYKLMENGLFPKPYSLGGTGTRAMAWKSSEIEKWIQQCEHADMVNRSVRTKTAA